MGPCYGWKGVPPTYIEILTPTTTHCDFGKKGLPSYNSHMTGVCVGRDRGAQGDHGHPAAGAAFRGMYLEAEGLQGLLANTSSSKRRGGILCYRFLREHGPAHTLVLNFQLPELGRIGFCCLSPSVCGAQLQQPRKTAAVPEKSLPSHLHSSAL